jgi:hypothetical protein
MLVAISSWYTKNPYGRVEKNKTRTNFTTLTKETQGVT